MEREDGDDLKVLEINNGDGCTTMCMYLMLLTCKHKMVKMESFMLCLFYHKWNFNPCNNVVFHINRTKEKVI